MNICREREEISLTGFAVKYIYKQRDYRLNFCILNTTQIEREIDKSVIYEILHNFFQKKHKLEKERE